MVLLPFTLLLWFQWLTLAACVLMWGPCLTELLLSKWELGKNYFRYVKMFLSRISENLNASSLYNRILTNKIHRINILILHVFNVTCYGIQRAINTYGNNCADIFFVFFALNYLWMLIILRAKSQRSQINRLAYRFSMIFFLFPRFLLGNHKHLTKVKDFLFAVSFLKFKDRSEFSSDFCLF
jgi:hypothetical protein